MRHLRLHRPARHDGVRASGRRRLILVVLTAAAAFAALAPAAAGNPPERVTGTVERLHRDDRRLFLARSPSTSPASSANSASTTRAAR